MNKLVTHLIAFVVGCALTFILLSNQNSELKTNTATHRNTETLAAKNNSTQSKSHSQLEDSASKNQLIEQQAQELTRLRSEIQSIRDELTATAIAAQSAKSITTQPEEDSETKLRTMNMQTFEESMKTQFTDQFKGIVLQLEGQRLEDIKSSYSSSSEKNEWSNQYENSIANYLAANDQNGDHYLQSLNCNTNVCRLEVNTNDAENWNRLYAKMTNEPWYQSITVQEKSDYPGNVIYYLPSLNN